MKNRCKDFGELSPANRLAGCMNIDINCTGLRARYARKANRTATNQKRKPPIKAKSSRFDNLVARYYPAVYSFASRLTDDPREAVALTRNAFRSLLTMLGIIIGVGAVITSMAIGSGAQARKEYQARGAKSPTEYLEALGVLGPNVLLAHALGIDDGEIDCIARTGAAVTMCPVTAAKGGRGVGAQGRMPELLARGVRVALGCDSPNNSNHLDLVRAMNMAAIQYKDARQDTTQIPAETALEMGTRLGAAAVGLGDEIGAIEPGKRADLVLFDTRRPEWQALWNPVNNLIYNTDGRSVHTVVIDGRIVVDNYRQTFVDEARLFSTVQEIGERLQARTGITFPRSRWPVL